MSLICVSLIEKSVSDLLESAEKSKSLGADLIEIRSDYLEVDLNSEVLQDLLEVKTKIGLPVIFTLRPVWEGGEFNGPEEKRLAILEEAIDLGFDYVDLELKLKSDKRAELIDKARLHQLKSIVSYHDFETTPASDEILTLIEQCASSEADLAKVVFNCSKYLDTIEILRSGVAAKERDFKFTVMGIGKFGHITRVLAPLVGCEIVYANLTQYKQVVEGQIDIVSLLGLWKSLKLDDLKNYI